MSKSEGKTDSPLAANVRSQITVSPDQGNKAQSEFEQKFKDGSITQQAEYAHLSGLWGHYRHKGLWSWFLMLLLASMIGFQCFLLYKVGVGDWDFTQYDWLLPVLLIQNLGQIISLAFVVVKSLFKDI